jgi:hypothetical protein
MAIDWSTILVQLAHEATSLVMLHLLGNSFAVQHLGQLLDSARARAGPRDEIYYAYVYPSVHCDLSVRVPHVKSLELEDIAYIKLQEQTEST